MGRGPASQRIGDSATFRAIPGLFGRRVPMLLFALLGVALVVIFGLLAMRTSARQEHAVETVRARLSSMTRVRQERIESWLQTCRADAEMVALFPTVGELLDAGAPAEAGGEKGSGDASDLVGHLASILDLVIRTHGYSAILLLDGLGNVVGSSGSAPIPESEVTMRALEAARDGQAYLAEPATESRRSRLFLIRPLTRGQPGTGAGEELIGVLLFRIDPMEQVAPLVENRVVQGESDEILLATPQGTNLVPLTRNRFPGEDDATVSILESAPPLPPGDGEVVTRGLNDYRGVPVYASIRRVRGTPWVIVGKIDASEAMQVITEEWAWLIVTAFATLLAVSILFLALSRHYRARHYQAVADQEARYRALAENARDIILIVDVQTRIVEANRAAAMAYGYPVSELLGMRLDVLRAPGPDPSPSDRVAQAMAGDIFFESEHRRRDGTIFPVEVSSRGLRLGSQALVVSIIRDITERRRLEKQSTIAQRMEALGQLAGGVAHDFNNLLTAIRGYSALVQETLPEDDPRWAEMEEVIRASDRAADLTRQLLAFSRRQAQERRVVDLNAVVRGLEGMLPRLIGENITFRTELDSRPLFIRADAGQIENLLVNLVVNARDAMAQGGVLTLVTQNVLLTVPGGTRVREYARLEVIDTGIGMDDEVRARAFEPFFTTKPAGKGTGLGLSTCYGIVQQNDGQIALESTPGQGTCVRVDLPMAVRTMTDEVPILSEGIPQRGTECILLAEDDAGVRGYTAQVLRSLGYTVLEAAGGPQALERVRSHGDGEIHLLLTDVVMPVMSGVDLRNRMREIRPELKALFVSGYAESSMFEMGGVERGAPVLRKPFTPAELGRKVREVLDRKPRPRPAGGVS